MPYGTDAFIDGNGDFKQPTVIDYDKRIIDSQVNKVKSSSPKEKEKILKQFQSDQEKALAEILEINPVFAGDVYQHLVLAEQGKLVWDIKKINTLKDNIDWLYNLKRYLNKRKSLFITT